MLSPNVALLRGVPTKVGEAINATGVNQVRPFSIIKIPGPEGVVNTHAIGSFTVFTGNVEISADGGTTWDIFLAFDFVASRMFVLNVGPGILYRFNVGAITQTLAPTLWAVQA